MNENYIENASVEIVDSQWNKQKNFSRVIPRWKFILLSISTFGLFELVWIYSNWIFIKEYKKKKIFPFLRTLFTWLFIISFISNLKKIFHQENIPFKHSPWLLWLGYIGYMSISRLPEPFFLLSFFSFLPLLPVLESMNQYWWKVEDSLPEKKFSWWQKGLIGLGILCVIWVFLITLLDYFFPNLL